jgi:hypothetical protein
LNSWNEFYCGSYGPIINDSLGPEPKIAFPRNNVLDRMRYWYRSSAFIRNNLDIILLYHKLE